MSSEMKNPQKKGEPGYLLGVLLIAILTVLLIAAWVAGMSTERPHPAGMGPVLMGLFLIALGLMILGSYFQPERSFFLRWLLRFSTGFPGWADKKVALLLFLVCVLSGLGAIADGMG